MLLLALASLIPLAAFAIFAVSSSIAAYNAHEKAHLRDIARVLAAAVDARLGSHVATLRTLAASDLLDRADGAGTIAALAARVPRDIGCCLMLFGPSPGHRLLAAGTGAGAQPRQGDMAEADRAAIDAALRHVFQTGEPAFSDLFAAGEEGRRRLAAFVPVDRPDQPRHVLGLGFDPSALSDLLAHQALSGGSFAGITDGRRRLIAHSVGEAGPAPGTPVIAWIPERVAAQQSAIAIGADLRGVERIFALQRLTTAPDWILAVAKPVAAVRAARWEAAGWVLGGGLALLLAVLILVWAVRREASRAGRREVAARRAGRGEIERLHAGLPAILFLRVVAPDGSSRLLYRGGDLEAVSGWPASCFAVHDNFFDLAHPEDRAAVTRMLLAAREQPTRCEWRIRQPQGGWRWLHTHMRPLSRRPDGSHEVAGYTVDVTAQRDAEARALAAARLASLGELSANLAHELKQPIQAISLAAEVAQIGARQLGSAVIEARLERIIEQAARTGALIEHLRRFARGTEDHAATADVPLEKVVEGTLELTRAALRDAEIAVETDLGDPAPIVRGHALLLEQVLSNLLLNARDALAGRPAGLPRLVRIAAERDGAGQVRLSLADNGGGIAPEVMARLFEPFVTTKDRETGTGLGLSICHGLVTSMGGSIAARNAEQGAVFTITLMAADATHAATAGSLAG